jgi:heme/copper-type cytochrome/quinol oxidase subunit 2
MTLKVVGAMWYWNYQYPSTINQTFDVGSFDSYLIDNLSINLNNTLNDQIFSIYRNLAVDEMLTLPTFKKIRLLITSQDTIHS